MKTKRLIRQTLCSATLIVGALLGVVLGSLVARATNRGIRLALTRRHERGLASLPDNWHLYDVADGLPGTEVRNFMTKGTGPFYLLMDRGWCVFGDGNVDTLRRPAGFTPAAVSACGDSVWLTSANARRVGLSRLNGNKATPVAEGFRGALWVAANGEVWCGDALVARVYHRDSVGEQVYDIDEVDLVVGLIGDEHGKVWAFGRDGVALWNGESWGMLESGGEASPPPRSFYSPAVLAPHGKAWHTASNGVTRIADTTTVLVYPDAYTAIDDHVARAKQGNSRPLNMHRWCVSPSGIVVCGNKVRIEGQWRTVKPLEKLKFHQIAGVHCRDDGTLWFFTDYGVFLREPGDFRPGEICP